MLRHELRHARVLGLALISGMLFAGPGQCQEVEGRATVGERISRDRFQQQLPEDQAQSAARPVDDSITVQLPAELETLLSTWEQKSAGIDRLRGTFMRYVYDQVYMIEKRARGMFWYEAPDHGRMDFATIEVPDPPVNPEKVGSNGAPYEIHAEENQRWICTGKEIFIIHDDAEMYDYVEIPPSQQGQNISEGPLPFLFGMQAEAAKQRYHLNLGEQHWPQGRVIERDGEQLRLRPQVHVVAYPKREDDAREWRRAEVLLDGETFLPRAIRLLDPTMNKETVYVFDLAQLRVNEPLWIRSPFNERPPRNFIRHTNSRTEGDAMPQLDRGIMPAGGPDARP